MKKPKKRTLAVDTHYRRQLHELMQHVSFQALLVKNSSIRKPYKKGKMLALLKIQKAIEAALADE